MKYFGLFLCFSISAAFFCQNSPRDYVSNFRINRFDFFVEQSVFLKAEKFKHELGLGFGIKKTIFQQRLNPELFYEFHSNFKYDNKFQAQGVLSYFLNFYNVNKLNREIHFFNELNLAANLSYGKSKSIFFEPGFGLISESFHSDFYNNMDLHLTYNYYAKFGFKYHF